MSYLLFACALGVAIFLAIKYLRLKRLIRTLSESLAAGRSTLAESGDFREVSEEWHTLVTVVNRLVDRMNELDKRSSGLINQLEATLGNLEEGVLILDRDSYILLANNSLIRRFPSLALSKPTRVEVGIRSAEFLEFVEWVKRGEGGSQREMHFAGDGGGVWMEVSAGVVANSGKQGRDWYLFVFHDVTSLKRLEQVRKQFVENASHELKTPVAVIRGFAETLDADHETMAIEDRRRFIDAIHRNSCRLALLIDDLLSLSQAESNEETYVFHLVNLAEWLPDYVNHASSLSNGAQRIGLSMGEGPINVSLDTRKFRQVLDNLIQNARKYGPTDALVEVGCSRKGGDVCLWVADQGKGIPEKDLERVFERFYRVDQGRSRETGGTGLGLSIVKHIVETHSGRVRACNRAEGGFRVEIALPAVEV